MRDAVASQLIRNDLSRVVAMRLQQAFEKPLRRLSVASKLQKDIYDFPILIHRSPQIVLDSTDLDEHLVDVESIAETLVTAFQPSRISQSEFIAP